MDSLLNAYSMASPESVVVRFQTPESEVAHIIITILCIPYIYDYMFVNVHTFLRFPRRISTEQKVQAQLEMH